VHVAMAEAWEEQAQHEGLAAGDLPIVECGMRFIGRAQYIGRISRRGEKGIRRVRLRRRGCECRTRDLRENLTCFTTILRESHIAHKGREQSSDENGVLHRRLEKRRVEWSSS